MRSLFRSDFNNVAGKLQVQSSQDGVLQYVKRGVQQVFTRFDAEEAEEEDDARFAAFTTRVSTSAFLSEYY